MIERKVVDKTKSGKEVIHGNASSYNNHRCRCEPCTQAWAAYIRGGNYVQKYREKKKKKKGVRINL